jgi:hypothetical protein
LRLTSEAAAGDVVHFSVSDIDEDETYVLEIGDRRLAEGSGNDAEEVSGQFTMPDLGGGERKVTVEAEIGERGERDTTTVKRKLRYLGAPTPAPAAAIAAPPPAPPAPVPAALTPAAVTPPEPIPSLSAPAPPASRATADRTRSKRTRRARKRRTTEQRRVESRRNTSAVKRPKKGKETAKPKRTRERARTAPLFDGVPESSGGSAAPGRSNGSSGLNAIVPPPATLTRAATHGAYSGPAAAVLAPALLGLAALALVGTATLRSRRRRPR